MSFQLKDYAFKKEDPAAVRERMLDEYWGDKAMFIPLPEYTYGGDVLRIGNQMVRAREEFERRFENRIELVKDGLGNTWQLSQDSLVVPVGYESKAAAAAGKTPKAIGPVVEWRDAVPGQSYMFPDVLADAQKAYRKGFVKGGVGGGLAAIIARKLLFK